MGVDYDCVEQMVYWTEVIKGTIVRAKYDGSDMEVIVNSGKTTSPEGKIKISSPIVLKLNNLREHRPGNFVIELFKL